MGAVLAMRWRMILTGALLALMGCGNAPNRTDLSLIERLVQGAGSPTAVAPGQMARAALAQLSEPVMLAVLETSGKTALLVPYGENGAVRTWTTLERQTVSLRGGRIVATRGLGADLMSGKVSDPRAVGGADHVLVTLNAANETMRIKMECQRDSGDSETIVLASGESVPARRVTETCQTPGGAVVNTFWFGPDGQVRQSRQWLGTTAGYLLLQLLRS